jgi:drug/metabolite transporter (DMT)-like permease
MIFATIFLNENITIYQIIAVAVILGGCYLVKR